MAGSFKRNRFVGFRIPIAFKNDQYWYLTQQKSLPYLKACLAVEICGLLSMLVNKDRATVILLLVAIIIGVLIILGGAILQYTLSKQFEAESNS